MFEIRKKFDIRGFSLDEFVVFLFNHEVPPERSLNGKRTKAWYNDAEVECWPEEIVGLYTRLFEEPGFLLERYSKEKLEQGFWAIMGMSMECSATEVIWNEEVDFQQRAGCIRSMFHLYEKLFAIDSLETSSYMWWDLLAFDWDSGNRDRAKGGDDLLMQDVIFETLTKILALPSSNCQVAALHGLGHLHHPGTGAAIDAYFSQNPNLDSNMRNYAIAAARFEVL